MLSKYSIQALLQRATSQLESISDSAFLDAELLLAHCIDKERTYLHTWPEKELDNKQLDCFKSLIDRRLTDYPVAYLIGKKAFWSLDLTITPDVLVPRPETELLVEVALEKIHNTQHPNVLDLGTGSGAIALAIASERSDAKITATDYSKKALDNAYANAVNEKLEKRISFIQSSWFERLDINKPSFDLIVSNPPYIDRNDSHLKGTIRHEPQQALVADNQGMSDIENIIQNSHPFLKKGGHLILEHGYDQAQKVAVYMKTHQYHKVKNFSDYNNLPRVTIGIYN